jgi:HEAT repeat protein
VRENAIITLGRLGDPTALNRLFEVALLKGNLLPVTEAIEKNLSQQPVKDLINELNDQSSPRRKLIANVLGKIKQKEATESLIKILQSNEDSWLRRNAAEALGEIGDEVAEDGLFETLRSDWNNDVRLAAAYALGKISGGKTLEYLSDTLIRKSHERNKLTDKMLMYLNGEQAIKVLLISLTDEDSAIRNVAALRLGEIRDEAAIHPLLDALKDEDSKVRYNAAWALGKIGDKQTISSLLNVLNNQNEENDVRGSAAQALGRIGDKQAVNGLLKALQDNSHDIHSAMADALGRIGDNKAVEGLIAALKHKNCPAVWSISLALGHIGDHRAVDSLMEVFNNERGFVRETALVSLGRIGGEKATKILIEKLSDDDPGIRSTAAQALGDALEKTDSEEAVGALLNTLADEYGAPLWFAANTLIQVNIKKLSAGLARALSHENNYVRRKAAQVVGFYSIESNIFEELSRMASTDADREVRAAAADAKEKFLHKLALFDVPTDELLAAENAGREEALEDTRSFIAHEVRHALLPLDMATKMLSEELSKSKFDREAVDEYVQIILEQTKAGFDVVSQLQEYAKTLTPDKQPTDIHALLKQSVEEKRLDCEQNNIRIVKKFGRLPKIDIDQEMIKAVLRNIIDNALESMERDGVLTLATYQNKNHAAIEISDTGKGIEPEHLRRVFELGFTTKLGKKGAGIGMALSRRYIEQAHKGHIAIANNINGKGATVKIVLPITERSSDNGN